MLILGIETSCDETSAAVVDDGRKALSNVIASQIKIHRKFSGVVPEIASRAHVLAVNRVVDEALRQAGMAIEDIGGRIEAVAYTRGPGLAGALLVGQIAAQTIAFLRGVPLVDVNHVEGHLYAALLEHPDLEPPFLCLVVSGGHTELIAVDSFGSYRYLGGTRDDAAGEAFDKVAKLLRLPYPGGPVIDSLARTADPAAVAFPRPYLKGSWDFSFSGLKTAVVNHVMKNPALIGNRRRVADVAASFQQSVIDTLMEKTFAAAREYRLPHIVIGGGVSANSALRSQFAARARREKMKVYLPGLAYCTDNAAMIAAAACFKFRATGGAAEETTQRIDPGMKLTNWKQQVTYER